MIMNWLASHQQLIGGIALGFALRHLRDIAIFILRWALKLPVVGSFLHRLLTSDDLIKDLNDITSGIEAVAQEEKAKDSPHG